MTNTTNHYHKFMQIWQQIEPIDVAKPDHVTAVQQTMEDIIHYLNDFAETLVAEAQQIQERRMLLEYCQANRLDDKLQIHFLTDQFKFLKKWKDDFEGLVFQANDRCLINLSAKEILHFVKLLRDAELLGPAHLKNSFHFLSRHFHTAQQDQLSSESLRKKYSQLDLNVVQQVYRVLKRLLELNKAYLQKATNSSV